MALGDGQVLARTGALDINAPCTEFEGATPLHLAAMAGSAEAVEVLLKSGANPSVTDSEGRTALECAQQVSVAPGNSTPQETWDDITEQLAHASNLPAPRKEAVPKAVSTPSGVSKARMSTTSAVTPSTTRTTSAIPKPSSTPVTGAGASGAYVKIGDRVSVHGQTGLVRFRGPTSFNKKGEWVGIQLDSASGKNNGSVNGHQYFRCKPNHGLFVRPSSCQVIGSSEPLSYSGRLGSSIGYTTPSRSISRPGTASRTNTVATPSSAVRKGTPVKTKEGFGKGSKVFANGKVGVVRYIGNINAAPGTFIGVELPDNSGRNDGSLDGQVYFKCAPNHGLFIKPERCTWRGIKVNMLL